MTDNVKDHVKSTCCGSSCCVSYGSGCSNYWKEEYFLPCLCPCMILGHMTTALTRETPYTCFNNLPCQAYSMGNQGIEQCLWMCLLSIPCYPCSCGLSSYLLYLRWKLKLFYPDDHRLQSITTMAMGCYYWCYWPMNLYEQSSFLTQVETEDDLIFQWDFHAYQDYIHPIKPETESYILLSFGPDSYYKAEFIRKLLQQVTLPGSSAMNSSAAVTMNPSGETHLLHRFHKPNAMMIAPEIFSSSPQYIQTGIRIMNRNNETGKISYLEYWDIPPNESNAGIIHATIPHAFASMYIFDCSHPISIPFIQQLFTSTATAESTANSHNNHHLLYQKPRILIILSKDRIDGDPLDEMEAYSRSVVEMDILYWAKRQGVPWFKMNINHEDDFHVLHKQLWKLMMIAAANHNNNSNNSNTNMNDSNSHNESI